MNDITIRPMEQADLSIVRDIEKQSFSAPWSDELFVRELTENEHAYYFVLVFQKKIVGYAGMWIVMNDAQVTHIAIHPDYRRRQLGERLFKYILNFAIAKQVERFSLEVRVSNIAAQKLYRKYGLVPGGIRKQYYTDNQEDAIVMWVNLS